VIHRDGSGLRQIWLKICDEYLPRSGGEYMARSGGEYTPQSGGENPRVPQARSPI